MTSSRIGYLNPSRRERGAPPRSADLEFRAGKIVPGFVDLQVNGGAGVDLLDCSEDDVGRLSGYLASTGTTSFLLRMFPSSSTFSITWVTRRLPEIPGFLVEDHLQKVPLGVMPDLHPSLGHCAIHHSGTRAGTPLPVGERAE
jgi:hypothetical protein